MTSSGKLLNLSQGAVSLHIKRLEDQLQCVLFRRDRRGHQLTAAGERLLAHATRLLAINDEIWSDMADVSRAKEVRLGIPYDLTEAFLAPVISGLSETHPDVVVDLSCFTSPSLLSALERGEIDLAVVEEVAGSSLAGENCECLAVDDLIWVGARNGKAHLRNPMPISFCNGNGAFDATMVSALAQSGMAWRAVSNLNTLEVVSAGVRLDLAVSTVLASTIPADVETLAEEDGLPKLPRFAINLYMPPAKTTESTRAVAQHLRQAFSKMPL